MSNPEEPTLDLTLEGKDFTCDRYNTTLYTFAGSLSMYNHVFLATGEPEGTMTNGSYVFSDIEAFGALKSFVEDNKLPHIANMNAIPECDIEAYISHVTRDLNAAEYMPTKWEYEV